MQEFQNPEDIKKYGRLVGDFDNAMKALATLLTEFDFSDDEILPLIGTGRYNSLADRGSGFVHYGRYLTGQLSGLFGAFVFIHFPELVLARRMPQLVGNAGFKLAAISSDQNHAWPLHEVAFSFVPRTSTAAKAPPGRICISAPLQGLSSFIPEGTPITSIHNARLWHRDKDYRFAIISPTGQELDEVIHTNALGPHRVLWHQETWQWYPGLQNGYGGRHR